MSAAVALVDELLAVGFPDGVPERLDPLIDRELCAELLIAFKLGLVFPFEGPGRPVRLALSAQGERDRWQAGVTERWPSEKLGRFLASVPPDTRLMVDSDGSDRAVFYLDDLQTVEHGLSAPHGMELMCVTLELPGERTAIMTRHVDPPFALLAGDLLARAQALRNQGALGLWSLRWVGDEVVSVSWITESRWRRNPELTRRVVTKAGEHPGWNAALACLRRHDRQGYPDFVELRADGGIDVTLGML